MAIVKSARRTDPGGIERLAAFKRAMAAVKERRARRPAGAKAFRVAKAQGGTPLPVTFLPVDANGDLLATPVRDQPVGDERCTAYAISAAMEAARCRGLQSSDAVTPLSLDDLFTGAVDLYVTAARAAKGVADVDCFPPGGTRCSQPGGHVWRLKWSALNDVPQSAVVDAMKASLVWNGPIAVSVFIYDDFRQYRGTPSEIYKPGKDARRLDDAHALCILGYDFSSTPTWFVRNSQTSWGSGGYGRIAVGDRKLSAESVLVAVTSVFQ